MLKSVYNKLYIDISSNDEEHIKDVIKSGIDYQKTNNDFITWNIYAFRKWSEASKWNPESLLIFLSQKYNEDIFSLSYKGNFCEGKLFIYNGNIFDEKKVWILPKFPTIDLLKSEEVLS